MQEILLGFILLVSGAMKLLPDETLLPEAEAWLAPRAVTIADEENARLYLLGLRAPEGVDPIAFGRAVEERLRELGELHGYVYQLEERDEEEVWPEGIDTAALLPKPGYGVLPDPLEVDSFDEYLQQLEGAEPLEHPELDELFMARYRTLLTLPHQQRLQENWLVIPQTPYMAAVHLQKRHHQLIVDDFLNGRSRQALDALDRDLAFNRMLLEEADYVLPTMLSVRCIARDLRLYSLLLDSGVATREVADAVAAIEPLSAEELDMAPAPRGQLVWGVGFYDEMGNGSLFENKRGTFGGEVLALAFWYHHNHVVNSQYRFYEGLVEATRLPPGADSEAVALRAVTSFFERGRGLHCLYNPVSCLFDAGGALRYHSFSQRVWDLDGLLRMVRLKGEIRARALPPQEVGAFLAAREGACVYGSTCVPIEWDEARQQLFFASRAMGFEKKEWNTRLPVPY